MRCVTNFMHESLDRMWEASIRYAGFDFVKLSVGMYNGHDIPFSRGLLLNSIKVESHYLD
jgi:hypothetical protein